MDFKLLKTKLKEKLALGADTWIPARLKDELGLNRPSIDTLQTLSHSADLDTNLSSFFKPVNSTFLSSRDYKNLQRWAIGFVILISSLLLILFFILISPHKDYSNSLAGSQIIVKGMRLGKTKPKSKIVYQTVEREDQESEELKVNNLLLETNEPEKLAKKSPLLKSRAVTMLEHKIRSGDNLAVIAQKYYNSSSPENIAKIKTVNKITNTRSLQVGQVLTIPM